MVLVVLVNSKFSALHTIALLSIFLEHYFTCKRKVSEVVQVVQVVEVADVGSDPNYC